MRLLIIVRRTLEPIINDMKESIEIMDGGVGVYSAKMISITLGTLETVYRYLINGHDATIHSTRDFGHDWIDHF